MGQREQMFVEAKRRYEHEKRIAERRGNRNVVSFDEWCETTGGEFVETQNGEIQWYCETNNKIVEL
jgi:hypothetical protein